MRVALIDADILAYQAAAVSETPTDWGDGIWTLHSFEDEATQHFDHAVTSIVDDVEADNFLLVFSDVNNWRKSVLPTYKSNRVGTRKPLLLKFLREYAMDSYESKVVETLEGDDVIGIQATTPSEDTYIVCTIDKDLKTIPGLHYHMGTGETFEVNEHQADKYHMMQTLTGDPTDGYAGCPGVGEKTAQKIIQAALDEGTPWANPQQLREIYWSHVVKAYEKAGLCEEEALVQAQVSRILRYGEYNETTKEVKLWTPN